MAKNYQTGIVITGDGKGGLKVVNEFNDKPAKQTQQQKEDLAALGLSEMVEGNQDFEVFAENWHALEVFTACQTQWNYAGMGSPVGINYNALESVMRMMNIDDHNQCFEQVRFIEQGALQQISENK